MNQKKEIPIETYSTIKVLDPDFAKQLDNYWVRIGAIKSGYPVLTDWHPVIPQGWGEFPKVPFQPSAVYRGNAQTWAYSHHQTITKFADCKADGSGYLRILKMELMPNVVCHHNAWLKLKVERRGNRIQMWVNGVKGPCVTDDTYGPGRVGIAGFAKYKVRNLRIDGKPVEGPAWKSGDHRGKPWFVPVPDTSRGDVQDLQGGKLLKLSDDEILLGVPICREGSDPIREDLPLHLFLSHDGGRTWSPHGAAQDGMRGWTWFVSEPGRIGTLQANQTGLAFIYRDSTDAGRSWSEPIACKLLGDWQRDILREGTSNGLFGITVLNDGTLLGVILHGFKDLQRYGSIGKIILNCGPRGPTHQHGRRGELGRGHDHRLPLFL